MADTWNANAWNQLCTLKALRNACTSGIYSYTTLPPDTREIATIGDLNTYDIRYYLQDSTATVYSSFTNPNNNECFIKNDLDMAAYFFTTLQTTTCTYSGSQELLYSSGTDILFAIGCQLYTNRARTTAKTFASSNWIYSFGRSYKVSTAGIILDIYAC